MSWYRTGTILVTNGSGSVTGLGTAWIANAAPGEAIYLPDGKLYEIISVNADTSMTLANAYTGISLAGQSYTILPSQSYIRDLAAQAATLINSYAGIANAAGAGKFGDGTLGAPGISFVNDTNTGIRRTADGTFALVSNGVDVATIGPGGMVLVTPNIGAATGTSLALSWALTAGSGTFSGVTTINVGNSVGDVLVLDKVGGANISLKSGGVAKGSVSGEATGLKLGGTGAYNAFNITDAGSNAATLSSTGIAVAGSVSAGSVSVTSDLRAKSGAYLYLNNAADNASTALQTLGTSLVVTSWGGNTFTLDASGKLGLGVTPKSDWYSGYKAIQIASQGVLSSDTTPNGGTELSTNAYRNTAGTPTYINSFAATQYVQYRGEHRWLIAPSGTAGNPITFTQAMTLDASGNLLVGATGLSYHALMKSVSAGGDVAYIGNAEGTSFYAGDAGSYNAANTCQKVGRVNATGRSINAGGTINASGADYAEYVRKAAAWLAYQILKGNIVGFNASGELTPKFSEAVTFGIKSTNPSYVGGDVWGNESAVGKRPDEPQFQPPKYTGPAQPDVVPEFVATPFDQPIPQRRVVAVPEAPIPPAEPTRGEAEGDISWARQVNAYVLADARYLRAVEAREAALADAQTVEAEFGAALAAYSAAYDAHAVAEADRQREHAARVATYQDALAAFTDAQAVHVTAVTQAEAAHADALDTYRAELAIFEAKLEAERQTVDRIAFAGQVPVNVLGATPGDYIVPVEGADGMIAGIAVSPATITPEQRYRAVGRVIAIEADGRARVIVMMQ